MWHNLEHPKSIRFFFCGGRGSNPRPYIYYASSLPTELNSRGQESTRITVIKNITTYIYKKI
jgi:hypothetical protein